MTVGEKNASKQIKQAESCQQFIFLPSLVYPGILENDLEHRKLSLGLEPSLVAEML